MSKSFSKFLFEKRRMQRSPPEQRKQYERRGKEEQKQEEKMEQKKERHNQEMSQQSIRATMRTYKGHFTRTVKRLQALVDTGNDDKETVAKMKTALDTMFDIINTLEKYNVEASMCPDFDGKDEDLQGYYDDLDMWERLIKRDFDRPPSRQSRHGSESSDETKPWLTITEMNFDVRNVIKTFTSIPEEYPTFKISWTAVDKKLTKMGKSDAEKLIELKKVLEGEAAELIKTYQDVDENYEAALNLIDKFFMNLCKMTMKILSSLIDGPRFPSTKTGVKEMYMTLTQAGQALKAMNISHEDKFNLLLLVIAERRLPQSIRREWEKMKQKSIDLDNPIGFTATVKDLEDMLFHTFKIDLALVDDKVTEEKKGEQKAVSNGQKSKSSTLNSSFGTQDKRTTQNCEFCGKKNHYASECKKFLNLSVPERRDALVKDKRCWLCFGKHKTNTCKFYGKWTCKVCKHKGHSQAVHVDYADKKSHSAMDSKEQKKKPDKKEGQGKENDGVQTVTHTRSKHVTSILGTLMAYAVAPSGEKTLVRVFFDGGSDCHLIRRDVAEKLGLQGRPRTLQVSVTGGDVKKPTQEKQVKFKLCSLTGDYFTPTLEAVTIKQVTSDFKGLPVDPKKFPHLKNVAFTEELPRKEVTVDILIGQPTIAYLREDKTVIGKWGEPVAVKSKLGYYLEGAYPEQETSNSALRSYASYQCITKNDNFPLENFWKTEHIGILPKEKDDFTVDEEQAVEQMRKTLKYDSDKREWSTELLWKKEDEQFDDNYYRAVAVMKSVEKAAVKQGKVDMINKAFEDLLKNGFAEEVPKEEISPKDGRQVYYLQAHPIYRDHETTPCRIVMNAGAKDKDGKSLNDRLLQGPCLLPDIASMLLKFRNKREIAIMDISKMFLRIKLNRDKDCQRFVWRGVDPSKPVTVFRMKTLIFGGVSSPFQAGFTLQEHAKSFEKEFPKASKAIHEDTYMDDIITGENTADVLKIVVTELISLLELASMMPHKIMSSNSSILQEIDQAMIAPPGPRKVLGLMWEPKTDDCMLQQAELQTTTQKETKRSLLQHVAQIFDPLGLCTPFVLKAKLLFQEICRQKIDWDEELEEKIEESWKKWKSESRFLQEFKQQRCLFQKDKPIEEQYLIGFGDASEFAYGSCVYLVNKYTDKTQDSNLVMAKSRVAPLNEKEKMTIVRLELLAMLTTARLSQFVSKSLNLPIKKVYSDSQINLARLKNGYKPYKSWVGNRIKEILSLVDISKWDFCPGTQNPADFASRGMDMSDLIKSNLWWKGPEEILSDPTKNRNVPMTDNTLDSELKKPFVGIETYKVHSTILDENYLNGLIQRFEKWSKVVRFVAYILRFCHTEHKEFRRKPLSVGELKKVEMFLIRKAQQTGFAEDFQRLSEGESLPKKSKLLNFNPKWDFEQNLIIAETRLIFSNLPNLMKRPIILPSDNEIVKKYVLHIHETFGHAGPNYTFAMLRQKFLIAHGKRQIRKIIRECKVKRCTKPKLMGQQMAPLPESRIDNPEPFKNVAVDLFGPMFVKHKCGLENCPHETETKAYGCLFTCFQTRAIHLELMKDGTTEEFLRAFRMMVARRGLPTMVYSDQAKNFKKASKELRKLYQTISWKKIGTEHAQKGINWTFNVPLMPHANGLCERMVQSVKQPLRIILGNKTLTFDELNCILSEVEMIVNNRPLDVVNQDEMTPITPAELMYGKRLDNLIDPNFRNQTQSKVDFTSMWKKRQLTLNSFWKRWSKTYLLNLQIRQKWKEPNKDNLINRIVLIRDDNLSRNEWKMARIEEVFLSKDGLIRSVGLKTPTGFIRRPIHKLALLENVY